MKTQTMEPYLALSTEHKINPSIEHIGRIIVLDSEDSLEFELL